MADHPPSTREGSPSLPSAASGDGLHSSTSNPGEQHPLISAASDKRAKYQTLLLLYKMAIQLIISGLLWGAIYQLLEFAEDYGVLNNNKRYAFNVGITGFPLLLGVQILSAFKKMAGWVRWRLLAHDKKGWTKQEADMILDLTSYETVTYLVFKWCRTRRHFFKGLLCILWIIIMLGTETLIALLGFTYSLTGDGALFISKGQVRATRLDYYYPSPKNDTKPQVDGFANEQYLAHLFGEQSETMFRDALNASHISNVSNDSRPSYGTVEMYRDGPTDWTYKFSDWTLLNDTTSVPFGVLSVSSARYVTIKTVCMTGILKGWNLDDFDQNRAEDLWNMGEAWQLDPQTEYSNFGPGAVTFFNPDNNAVVEEPDGTKNLSTTKFCGGPRCATIGIFALTGNYRDGNGAFYECNITVSEVFGNSNTSNQTMTDHVARLAAGSIGLDGIIYHPKDKNRFGIGGTVSQFYRYNNDTLWGHEVAYNSNRSTETVARLVGGFAAGSIASLDMNNPTMEIRGRKVEIGVRVHIEWFWMKLLISICLGVHSILVGLVLWLTHPIILPKDSHLAVADIIQVLKTHSGMTEDHSQIEEKRFKYNLRRRSMWEEQMKALEKERELAEEERGE